MTCKPPDTPGTERRRLVDVICRPRSVAIATSLKPNSLGMNICKGLVKRIFEYVDGAVRSWYIPLYIINQQGGEVEINGEAQTIYRTIGETLAAAGTIEILIITISSKFVLDILEAIPTGTVRAAIISSGGFSEKDEQGEALEERVKQLAIDKDFAILGMNTLGVFTHAWNSSFTDPPTTSEISMPGKAVVLVQSGGMSEETFNYLNNAGASVKFVLGTGSTPERTFVDLMNELLEDDDTKCVGFYLEFMPGRDSYLAMQALAFKKPVIVYFAKTNPFTTRIARSHTGKLASSFEVLKGALRQAKHVLLCTTQREFFSTIAAITVLPSTPRTKTCVVTITGGAGIAAASQLDPDKEQLPLFPDELQAELAKHAVDVASVQNPIDLTGSVTTEQFKNILKTLHAHLATQHGTGKPLLFDTLLVIPFKTVPLLGDDHKQIYISYARRFKEIGVSCVICDVGARYTPEELKTFAQNGIFHVPFPDDIGVVLTAGINQR